MHPFERHIKNTIESRALLRLSSPVLVALSGGADSVALLSVLVSLGYDCIAAHCNYHLRGTESIRDMRHAESVARSMGVNIYIREFNVKDRISQTGESIEMACRELRYAWFHELLDRDCTQAIAVAHHREDNVETFFLNLLRSSGITGLCGMDYRRDYVVRPMLDVSRNDIEQYLRDKGLEYVTDSSNALNDYKRNRLRNLIIPAIENNFPGATDAILSSMTHLRQTDALLDHLISKEDSVFHIEPNRFNVGTLLSAHGITHGTTLLYEMLKPHGFNATQAVDIIRAVEKNHSGLVFPLKNGTVAELDRGILTIQGENFFHSHPDKGLSRSAIPNTKGLSSYPVSLTHDILFPVHIHISRHDVTQFRPTRNPAVAYIDEEALNDNPVFELRKVRNGDRMKPFGMTGTKLVSDILTEAKLSAAQKRDIWILTRNDVILWVTGIRASSFFAVTPLTRRYLQLSLV